MSRTRNVLITGAAGFVGSRLARRLRRHSPDLQLTLTGHRPGFVDADPIYELDVSDETRVRAFIAETRPTTIFHLAAVSAISSAIADQRKTWLVNAMGPYNIATSLLADVPDCHLVFVSSAEVYGRSAAEGVKLSEQHLLQPSNPYASAKAAADIFVQEAAGRGLIATVMRPFNHIGPGQSLNFAIPSFCSQIVNIEKGAPPVIQVGSLEDVRDFLHVDDVIDAYLAATELHEQLTSGSVFNVASGIPVRMRDVLERLIALANVDVRVEVDQARLRGRLPTSVVGDATKATEVLGWRPRGNLDDTLRETLEYWRARQ
jgi:GDP-4-dehydro-6-deoxy-D-mannose reductase